MFVKQMMSKQFEGNPLMSSYHQMMDGKTPEEQKQVLINIAKSQGIQVDPNDIVGSILRAKGMM